MPVIEGEGHENRKNYEPAVDAILTAMLSTTADLFVDVGANVGQMLIKVKTLDPSRHYVGFEASPFCCYYVFRVIAENRYRDCVLVPRALSDEPGVGAFHFTGLADPQATVVDGFWDTPHKRANSTTVLLDRGDNTLAMLGNPRVGIIKIDVEGGELEVLKGFSDTIARDRSLVLCEVLNFISEETATRNGSVEVMQQRRTRCEALAALMQSCDYGCYRLMPDATLFATWDYGMDVYDDRMTNYIFVPNEKSDLLADLSTRYAAALSQATGRH